MGVKKWGVGNWRQWFEGKNAEARRALPRCRTSRLRGESLESRQLLAADSLVISEFMASNALTLRDRFRSYEDWIEIHNPTDQSVNLEGWALTDDPANLQAWTFPAVSLEAGGYLVVFASGRNEVDPARELHTNFSLRSEGEYLALVGRDGQVTHAYSPAYPPQFSDVSYGLEYLDHRPVIDSLQFFVQPTPGKANEAAVVTGRAEEVSFSVERGYFTAPIAVSLSSAQPGVTIRYTTDGSAPSETNGNVFQEPIAITTTTTLRAAAFANQQLPSAVMTQTYIFLDDVLKQTGEGLPTQWGYFDDQGPARPARARANYAMDPDVVNSANYKNTIRDDLRSIPTLSLVMDPKDLWDFENGIYSNPERHGDAWERPVSVEWLDQAGKTLFQANAGLRVHGGWARRFTFNSKFSFRVAFRGQYGDTTLEQPIFGETGQQEFEQLVLRGGFNDSWQGGDRNNTYLQDLWTRETQRAMGGYAVRSTWVHLYLNGLYWGLYSPTERPDAAWAAATRGGSPDEYDVMNTGATVIDGNNRAWSTLTRAINRTTPSFQELDSLVDMNQFIDYLITNQYVGNWDWPHNNWYASRRRADGEKWLFHSWDAEAAFQNGVGENRVANTSAGVGPADLYLKLKVMPEFQQLYSARIAKHMYNDGVLTPDANRARLDRLSSQIDRAIVGESARWGDGRVDSTNPPLTRDNAWLPRLQAIKSSYFAQRGRSLLNQFRSVGFYGTIEPPTFNQFGGRVTADFPITIAGEAGGEIFYTTDGTDPLMPDGSLRPSARSFNAIELASAQSAARLLVPTGAASEASWQTLDYADSHWIDGSAAFGWDTGEVDDPVEVPGGFRVRQVFSSLRLDDLAITDRVLAGESIRSEKTFQNVPSIDYLEGTRGGVIDGSTPFPGGTGDNYALDVTGTIRVHKAGIYTFGITRNDGARLEIAGQTLLVDAERVTSSDIKLYSLNLNPGDYPIHVVMFERNGTASLELFYASGAKTEVDSDFSLLGSLRHRPYGDLIRTDLRPVANDKTSVYARIPFELQSLDQIEKLLLRARYDDGLVVYVNGKEAARRLAPDTLNNQSRATGTRGDDLATKAELIDLSSVRDQLRIGKNVLAIHLLNADPSDPDLLFQARLTAELSGQAIHLPASAVIQARVQLDEQWSAVVAPEFRVAVPASSANVRISEIHFHPADPSDAEKAAGWNDADEFEFLELVNIGTQAIDLDDLRLEDGIVFHFVDGDVHELAPGQRVVVVDNLQAFRARYGDQIRVAGAWSGALSNAGERITLRTSGEVIHSFSYSDQWAALADGQGASLEFLRTSDAALADWENGTQWQASVSGGTPGEAPRSLVGDANRDGIFDEADLIQIFQAATYEDAISDNSVWESGDWNGDGEFTSQDLVLAFMQNTYRGQ